MMINDCDGKENSHEIPVKGMVKHIVSLTTSLTCCAKKANK